MYNNNKTTYDECGPTECPSIQEFFGLLIIYNQVLIWNWRKEKGEVIQNTFDVDYTQDTTDLTELLTRGQH